MKRNSEANFDWIARPYRWMEYATFGRALERCRNRFLTELRDCRSALALGKSNCPTFRKRSSMSTFPASDSASLAPTLRHAFGWSIALAILLTIAGFLAIVMPVASGVAVTLLVGWFFAFVGCLHLLFAWKTHTTSGVLWEILLGILYLVSGIYLMVHPLAGLASLTLFLGAYFLVKGILEIIHFFQIRPRHGAGWLLYDGIVSLILAVLIGTTWPFSSLWTIGTLLGIGMMFTGISRLMLSITARRMITA